MSRDWEKRNPEKRRAQNARYRARHPDALRLRRLEAVKRNTVIINAAKDVPCMDCGVRYPPYVMEFDHRRDEKRKSIAQMKTNTVAKLLTEMAKCDIVCSNCHAERTYQDNHQVTEKM